jgi:hypothetical protein
VLIMEVEDYRAAYEAEIAQADEADAPATKAARAAKAKGGKAPTAATLLKVIRDAEAAPEARIEAIEALPARATTQARVIEGLIALLGDTADSPAVRTVALSVLSELSFAVGEFQPHQAAYREALRAAATDPDRKLRERVLEILALQGDEYAQRLLVTGLEDPGQRLVSERKAVQYLGYDVHGEHHPLLREVVERSDDRHVRNAALRLLAGDGDSKDLFVQIVKDKREDPEARSIGAVALQSLDPGELVAAAQQVVLDDDDDDEVRAAVLTVLNQGEQRDRDPTLHRQLSRRKKQPDSAPLAKAMDRYLESDDAGADAGG